MLVRRSRRGFFLAAPSIRSARAQKQPDEATLAKITEVTSV